MVEESGWANDDPDLSIDCGKDDSKMMLDLENENFVLKQEIEQIKNKARQMLEDKDDEIDKLK